MVLVGNLWGKFLGKVSPMDLPDQRVIGKWCYLAFLTPSLLPWKFVLVNILVRIGSIVL